MCFQSIKDELQKYIQKTFPKVVFSDSFHLSKPPNSKLGHFAMVVFPYRKLLKKIPPKLQKYLQQSKKILHFNG